MKKTNRIWLKSYFLLSSWQGWKHPYEAKHKKRTIHCSIPTYHYQVNNGLDNHWYGEFSQKNINFLHKIGARIITIQTDRQLFWTVNSITSKQISHLMGEIFPELNFISWKQVQFAKRNYNWIFIFKYG